MTNTLQSVESTGSWSGEGNGVAFLRYSGGVYNRYIGDYGAHVIHGGGHAASEDNSVFLANYNTLQFERVGDPTDLGAKYVSYAQPPYTDEIRNAYGTSYGYFIAKGPNSTGWTDPTNAALYELADEHELNPREIVSEQPGSAHTYDCLLVLPPSVCADPQGALIRPVASAIGSTASRSTGFSHVFGFTDRIWSRWSSNALPAGGTSAALDSARNRIWTVSSDNRNHSGYLDLATRSWVVFQWSYPPGGGYPDDQFSAYHVERDLVAMAYCSQGAATQTFAWMPGDTANGVERTAVTWTNGTEPPSSIIPAGGQGAGSLVYVPDLGKLIWYAQRDMDRYYEIDVPADPAGPWTWTAKDIAGVAPSSLSPAPYSSTYKRFDYAPQLRSILWVTGQSGNLGFGATVLCIRVAP